MAQKVGKYKVSKREAFLDLQDAENNTPSSLTVDTNALKVTQGGGVHIGGTTDPGDNNLKVDGTIEGVSGDITATAGDFKAVAGTLDVADGGAVTQTTNRTNGVTLNKVAGKVTGNNTSLAAVTIAKHTVTNSTVGANDVVIVSKVSGDADTSVYVDAIGAGSFDVAVRNNHASAADTTALVYNFVVIHGANS